MRSIRIEPVDGGTAVLVDVICKCDRNDLTNLATNEASFKHRVQIGGGQPVVELICRECGTKYGILSQSDHIHVYEI